MLAQSYTALLKGRIADPAGLPISHARVEIRDQRTGRELTVFTDGRGAYVVRDLAPSHYEMRAEAEGFRAYVEPDIVLEVAQERRIDATLELGDETQVVTVEAQGGIIDGESGQRGQTVTDEEIHALPLNGRNYLSLALLAPGVVPAAAGQNPNNLNGARADHVSYLLDGVNNMRRRGNEQTVLPSLEVVQEFRILTDSFSAEYGRMAGVVSVAMKSGGNDLHGSLFEFFRNDALDARGFFDAQTPRLKRNQFGGLLGGPIRTNRAFFLISYEGLRNREEQTKLSRVPTLDERQGRFSSPLRDPATGAAFPANEIPASRIDPVARRLLEFVPLPNRTGVVNFGTVDSIDSDRDAMTAKVDFLANDRNRFSLRTVLDLRDGSDPFRGTNLPGFGSVSRTNNQNWGLTYTRLFSPAVITELRLGFGRTTFTENSVNAGKNTAADAGLLGTAPGSGLTNIVVAGYTPFGDVASLPSRWADNSYSLSSTTSWVKGRHLVKFGGEFQRAQYSELFGAYTMGQLAFINGFSGNAFGDFLLGLPAQAQRQVGTNKAYLLSNMAGAFIQDSWQIASRLTLDFGLRYDLSQPPLEKYDRWANFLPELGRSILAGDPDYPRSLLRTDPLSLSPRFGFAWRVGPEGRTVIRGGYGVFFDYDMQFQVYQALGGTAYPFTRLELLQASARAPLSLADPFGASTAINPAALSPNGWEYRNPSPYTQNWNFTLGRRLTANTGVELAYVGAKGTHLSAALNLNQRIRTPQGDLTPFAGLGRVIVFEPEANSTYQALQAWVRHRASGGLSFRSGLTLSKAIDQVSFGSAARQPQDARDLGAERGLADFDRRLTWSGDVLYDLPVGRTRRFGATFPGWLQAIAGGWGVNVMVYAYSGLPFTPSQTGNSQAGQPTRPDRLGDGSLAAPGVGRWFDPAAFAITPLDAFRFGDSGRNILVGPGSLTVDAGIAKEFVAGEGRSLQFRGEFFNALNRANFGLPATAIDQPTAGVITSAGPGRQIQLGLKFSF